MKQKESEATEPWMITPILFTSIRTRLRRSGEPLIIESQRLMDYLGKGVYVVRWGSSVEVMFEHCFENLPEKVKAGLRETRTDLVGFAGEVSKPLGKIELEFPTPKGIATLIARTITIAECRKREEKQMVKEETPQEEGGMDVTEQIIVNPAFPTLCVTLEETLQGLVRSTENSSEKAT
ncbi:hypothetical protein Tco_0624129 [Tanacetum coccineum]|uniref:Uncharacterized protein n=1 Tax=Tanacetum coccineum TaxID=301880 RepID=A0ABQ4WD48_9ASTR